MKIKRTWAMPNKNTFSIKPIRHFMYENKPKGKCIDPFANESNIADITNDLNENFCTDYNLDAIEFLKLFKNGSVDCVLYDPPYSPRQVKECYEGMGKKITQEETRSSHWSNHKKEIARVTKIGGKVFSFGWNSGGIGKEHGFIIRKILLVAHGGMHHDTICVLEEKVSEQIKLEVID